LRAGVELIKQPHVRIGAGDANFRGSLQSADNLTAHVLHLWAVKDVRKAFFSQANFSIEAIAGRLHVEWPTASILPRSLSAASQSLASKLKLAVLLFFEEERARGMNALF
jgi:hypothetical protein